MRNGVFIDLALLFLLSSCGTTTRMVHSWRDPDVVINTATTNKFVVAALLKNETVRKRTEDLMSFYYPGKAVSSYKKFGVAALEHNQEFYDEELRSDGFDAVVVLSLLKVDRNSTYVAGEFPDYYNNWLSFYKHTWSQYDDPGSSYAVSKAYYVVVNVYSLLRRKLVWSGVTSTINPSGSDDLFDNVIDLVNEKMRKEGFLQ